MSDLTTLRADFASLCAALPAASNSAASPLSAIVHRDDSHSVGKALTRRLKDLIPRQQFKVPLQAAIGQKIVASAAISRSMKCSVSKPRSHQTI